MARKLTNGTTVSIGATFGTTTAITGTSNANPAIATFSAGHGLVTGEYVEILTHDWPQLVGRVFKTSVATNAITLVGLDAASTTDYPAGGTGSGRRIITWVAVQQLNADGLTIDGGEQQFLDGQYIDSSLMFRIPTNQTPIGVNMVVDDDQSLTYWTTVRAAEVAKTGYPIKLLYPGTTGNAAGSGIWTVSAAPAFTGNNVQKRTIAVSMLSRFSEYTS